MWRLGSPSSGSILITWAPPSARTCPAHGTAMKWPNSTTVTPANGRSVLTGSRLHERVPVRGGDGAIEVAEAALVAHLAGGVEHPGHGGAIERGRREVKLQRPRRRHRRRHALGGVADVVERRGLLAGRVLDQAADQPDPGSETDGLRLRLGLVAEDLFQIGGDRKIGRGHDGPA